MSETPTWTPGRVVWREMTTPDPERSKAFYTALFDWKTRVLLTDGAEAGPPYTLFVNGGLDVAGLMHLGEAEEMPPHWMPYVSVEDVTAAADIARKAGGALAVPPTEIPGVGRFCVILDPQGGPITAFRVAGGDPPVDDGPVPAGRFCWEELNTPDPEDAARFYGDVFGWTVTSRDLADIGPYRTFARNGHPTAGLVKLPDAVETSPLWLSYVAVADADATARRARELGADIVQEPAELPGFGRFAVLIDPVGAIIAVRQTG